MVVPLNHPFQEDVPLKKEKHFGDPFMEIPICKHASVPHSQPLLKTPPPAAVATQCHSAGGLASVFAQLNQFFTTEMYGSETVVIWFGN